MKIIYLITAVFLLSLIGCSSTYKVSDFSSKDKFYEDFNNFARNKNVKVTLLNDSTFSINSGAAIRNDSLFSLGEATNIGNKKLALSDTKEINYTSNDYKSAAILLKNGERYRAEQIDISRDSINFSYTNKVITFNDITSLNKVKIISYKNNWLGIPIGVTIGTTAGLLIGVSGIVKVSTGGLGMSGTEVEPNLLLADVYCTLSGLIVGVVAGWFIGSNYTYYFNY